MSKIYRLHSGASDTVQDWTRISTYLDTAQIDKIKDPAGANARTKITSIPSPFACIDLVKTAFKQVTASGQTDGISIFHKMVSDALDVGEVFFNSLRLSEKIEIIPWNPGLRWIGGQMVPDRDSDLGELLYSGSDRHRIYGETLRMFFSQDAAEYNFDRLQQVWLLHYKDGQGRLNIIGGTSPATLFFASANKMDEVMLNFGNDRLFDDQYCPLYERSSEYILFLYALREAMPDFKKRFSVIDDYLELCLKHLDGPLREQVKALDSSSYIQRSASVPIAGTGNNPEILGYELRGRIINERKPLEESDFVIAATKELSGLHPLVLPAYTFTGGLQYVDGKWPAQLRAPFFDPLPLAARKLPGQEIKYPYLTTSDFLEPYLLRLPFEPDQDKFFCGNFPKGTGDGYLLPLTRDFFKYFSTADLQRPQPDGKYLFSLEKLPDDSIRARLHIPIKNGRFIDMERIYEADKATEGYTEAELSTNRGIIRRHQFSLVIYPFVKRGTDEQAAYTVLFLDHGLPRGLQYPYRLRYYKDTAPQQEIIPKAQRRKSNKQEDLVDTVYDVVQSEFDFISLEYGNASGCLVPRFPVRNGNNNRQYAFAIDFGTTNTHIEYSVDGAQPQPFDITAADPQLGMLHTWNDNTYNSLATGKLGKGATFLLESVPKELMPEYIGGSANKYKFPRRTVVSEPVNINLNADTYPLADFSVYWQYEGGLRPRQLQYHTNLKWSSLGDREATERRIGGYLANLVLLIRNKVVLNNGDLSKTKITWFYPTSMSQARLNTFEHIWHQLIAQYIGPDIQVSCLPESVAPFYYFRNQGIRAGNEPVINIDIGGGTTDVVVYKNQDIVSYTSFRFAGNALFGDGYGNTPLRNGFVQFFDRQYRHVLKESVFRDYLPPIDSIPGSDDFITTLFGLEHHPDRGNLSFSFTEKLRGTEELKIVPLLFISSIFYHVARYQQHRNEGIPRYITFSGTASKMLQILDVSKDLRSMTKLANQVFNDVFDSNKAGIELVLAKGPKEVTAKGGLSNPSMPTAPKSVLFGTEGQLGNKRLSYNDALGETTQEIVVREVAAFIDLFFSWNDKLDFTNEFGLSTKRFAAFKQILKKDLEISLVEGIQELREEMQEDSELKETLFFMPLRGALNKLAFEITENE